MANPVRIKRRLTGGAAGAPSSLKNAELAFNEQDNTLYYGKGDSGGNATSIIPIAGPGAFASLASPALTGTPSAPTATAGANTTQIATTAFVTAAVAAGGGGGGGGAVASGAIYENSITITDNYTMTAGKNGLSAGPIEIATGVTVTIPTGSVWKII